MKDWFHAFANRMSQAAGSPLAFIAAVLVIIVWAVAGPAFGFSDTWQLVINTGTTIITFLIVFLIQNTQNRDARAMHLKLDELIKAVKGARTKLIDLEEMSEEELAKLQEEFKALRARRDSACSESGRGEAPGPPGVERRRPIPEAPSLTARAPGAVSGAEVTPRGRARTRTPRPGGCGWSSAKSARCRSER
jgi:low affinity Fe/Cu permease